MENLSKSLLLTNGVAIPWVGFGTYKATDAEAADCVKTALKVGYRHIDTAYFYGKE